MSGAEFKIYDIEALISAALSPKVGSKATVDVSDPLEVYSSWCRRSPDGFQAASLSARLEIATRDDRPGSALIKFAQHVQQPACLTSVSASTRLSSKLKASRGGGGGCVRCDAWPLRSRGIGQHGWGSLDDFQSSRPGTSQSMGPRLPASHSPQPPPRPSTSCGTWRRPESRLELHIRPTSCEPMLPSLQAPRPPTLASSSSACGTVSAGGSRTATPLDGALRSAMGSPSSAGGSRAATPLDGSFRGPLAPLDESKSRLGAGAAGGLPASRRTAARFDFKAPERCRLVAAPPDELLTGFRRVTEYLRLARLRCDKVPSVRAYPAVITDEKDRARGKRLGKVGSIAARFCSARTTTNGDLDYDEDEEPLECQTQESASDESEEDGGLAGIPWAEAELENAFRKFAGGEDSEVHIDELVFVLRYLGVRASEDEVCNLAHDFTNYHTLDWCEFINFIKKFREYDVGQMKQQFYAADSDRNGCLDLDELHNMCVKLGYSPTRAVTLEALHAIDLDGSGTVTFDEFEILREHLRASSGFTLDEADELKKLYVRVVGDAERKLTSQDIQRINNYLGYKTSMDDINHVVAQVDKEAIGRISFDELLKIIRLVRDIERNKLLKLVTRYRIARDIDIDGDPQRPADEESTGNGENSHGHNHGHHLSAPTGAFGGLHEDRRSNSKTNKVRKGVRVQAHVKGQRLDSKKLGEAMRELGYYASDAVIQEILGHELKGREEHDSLSIDELDAFMINYRRREGFTQEEHGHLKTVFDMEQQSSAAGSDDSKVDSLELVHILRWFGITSSAHEAATIIEEADFSGEHQLDFLQLTKLMRYLLQMEAEKRLVVFSSFHDEETGLMRCEHMEEAIHMATGYMPDEDILKRTGLGQPGFQAGEGVTYAGFEEFFRRYRSLYVDWVAQRYGFIPWQVNSLRKIYEGYDTDENGMLDPIEMRQMVWDLVPEAVMTIQGKAEIIPWLPPAGSAEKFTFDKFLFFMRRCFDLRDEKDIVREAEVVKACSYSTEDVEALRAIFSGAASYAGELEFSALVDFFEQIVDLSPREREDLSELVKQIHPENRTCVRFPQFLMVVHKVTSGNLMGISDAAERVVRRSRAATEAAEAARPGPRRSSRVSAVGPEVSVGEQDKPSSRRPSFVQGHGG